MPIDSNGDAPFKPGLKLTAAILFRRSKVTLGSDKNEPTYVTMYDFKLATNKMFMPNTKGRRL